MHCQVGQSAGAGRLDVLQQRVRLAIYCALGAGVIAFAALAGLQFPVSAFFALSSEVRLSLLPLCGMHSCATCLPHAPIYRRATACALGHIIMDASP